MEAKRGVRFFFNIFLRHAKTCRINSATKPSACYSTDKTDVAFNPFFDKYAEKIKRAQGKRSSERSRKVPYETFPSSTACYILSVMDEIACCVDSGKASLNYYDNILEKEIEHFKTRSKKVFKKSGTVSRPNSSDESRSLYGQKGLDSIMHIEKVKDESASTIEKLWREYHRHKDSVSAVIPAKMYDKIQERAKQYPIFIYPVPRNDGYELMVGEFSGDQFYLTSVLNYQTLGENAPWLTAFTHFTELKESKGIVLMAGEVNTNYLEIHEIMFIANLIQLYYGTDDEIKLSLLKTFNMNPDQFNHMSVVEEMQKSTVQSTNNCMN